MDDWIPIFTTRQAFSLEWANKPYIETLNDISKDGDDQFFEDPDRPGEDEAGEEDITESDEDASVVRTFMQIGHKTEGCLPQADKVVEFCQGCKAASLDAIRSGNEIPHFDSVALVIEQGHEGARVDRGPLDPVALYWRLKKARFKDPTSNESTSASVCPIAEQVQLDGHKLGTPLCGKAEDDEPDAEQQLVFISDLNPWYIHALIGTAPYMQVTHLQNTFYRHLAFEPYFNFNVSMKGLPMFHLNFNLPYFALRRSKEARGDDRKYNDGVPLRQYLDVSFLNGKNDPDNSFFLYEAQISCTVCGHDEGRWTGYCFVDTYFNQASEREAARTYHQDSLADQGASMDPFTQGHCELVRDVATLKPCEYFLTVLGFRLQQGTNEWIKLVNLLTKCSRQCEQTLLSTSGNCPSTASRKFVTKANYLSKKLHWEITTTIKALEEFCNEPAIKRFDRSESAYSGPLLQPIKLNLNELKQLREKLKAQTAYWADFTTDVEVNLTTESMKVASLTVAMMLLISPVALASGIFSMDKDVIPFMDQTFRSFVCTVVIFGAVGAFALAIHSGRSWSPLKNPQFTSSKQYMWISKFLLQNLKLSTLRDRLHLATVAQGDEENKPVPPVTRALGTIVLKPNSNSITPTRTASVPSSRLHGFV